MYSHPGNSLAVLSDQQWKGGKPCLQCLPVNVVLEQPVGDIRVGSHLLMQQLLQLVAVLGRRSGLWGT